jgi:hypothetical protein
MERSVTRNRIRIAVLTLGAIALALASCSDGDGGVSDEEFLAAAELAAQGSILTIEDVPDGWRSEPDEPAGPDEGQQLTGDCAYLEESAEGFVGQVAFVDSDALIGPTHEINTEASVFRSPDEAHDTMNRWIDTYLGCEDEIFAVFAESPGFDPDQTYDYAEISVRAAGDETRGVRATITSTDSTAVVDFLFFRQGHIVGSFIYGGENGADEDRDRYAAIQAEKAAAADEALPD